MVASRSAVVDVVDVVDVVPLHTSIPHRLAVRSLGLWYARHLTAVWLSLGVVLATLQSAYFRTLMNPDGISYLDMGDAYLRGDWATAIRSHWSPLYGWLLSATVQLARPTPALEFPLVHLVNLAIFVAAFGAFSCLLRQLRPMLDLDNAVLPVSAWYSLAYAFFLFGALQYGMLELVTPDLLVAAFVFSVGALVLRSRQSAGWRNSLLLGLALGAGYLAKAPLLPLAAVFVGMSVLLVRGRARRVMHTALSLAGLSAVAVPFIVVLSLSYGRVTAGDSATLNYLWQIDGVTPFYYWQGGPDSVGEPVHKTDLLLQRPVVYGFDSPFNVTYGTWYAPDYWYEGATPHFVLSGQIHAILDGLGLYAGLASQLAIPLSGLAVLLVLGRPRWRPVPLPAVVLLVPAVAALGMYALVLVEARYVAPFWVLLLIGVLALARRPAAGWRRTASLVVASVMLLAVLVPLGDAGSRYARSLTAEVTRGTLFAPDEQAVVADALRQAGIQPGDAVASGDRGLDDRWARLARVRIVAEVFDRDGADILNADAAARVDVEQVLMRTHARAIVAPRWPGLLDDPEWRPISGTSYFFRLVTPTS